MLKPNRIMDSYATACTCQQMKDTCKPPKTLNAWYMPMSEGIWHWVHDHTSRCFQWKKTSNASTWATGQMKRRWWHSHCQCQTGGSFMVLNQVTTMHIRWSDTKCCNCTESIRHHRSGSGKQQVGTAKHHSWARAATTSKSNAMPWKPIWHYIYQLVSINMPQAQKEATPNTMTSTSHQVKQVFNWIENHAPE